MEKYPNIQSLLGQNVRLLRKSKKWTQMELAIAVEMEPTYISVIELGKTNPGLEIVAALAKALDCEYADLFKIEEEETTEE